LLKSYKNEKTPKTTENNRYHATPLILATTKLYKNSNNYISTFINSNIFFLLILGYKTNNFQHFKY